MLTKEDRIVLQYLIDESDDNYFYLDDSNTILNMPRNELILILGSLGERGYLKLKTILTVENRLLSPIKLLISKSTKNLHYPHAPDPSIQYPAS